VVVEPDEGSRELEVLAWNTSQPERGHNVSHAEKQFVEWMWNRPHAWKKRLNSVLIHVEGREVCDKCLVDLNELETHLKSLSPGIVVDWTGKEKTETEPLEVT
jgi:hypothetical protein